MPAADEGGASITRQQAALFMLLAGAASIVVSMIWPNLPGGNSAWSEDQARQYQSASAKLHELSHKYDSELSRTKNGGLPAEFQQAKDKYDQLRQKLDAAQRQPTRIATLLFCGGILFSVAGTAIYFASRRE